MPYFRYLTALIVLLTFTAACGTKTPPLHHIPPDQNKTTATSSNEITPQANFSSRRSRIIETAQNALGTHYRWGGTSPEAGFDCSGLAVHAYKTAGIKLPRTTRDQLNQGESIRKSQLLPGDLVFFKNPKSNKTLHVGIYTGNNSFIHAPGKGRRVTYWHH